MNEHLQAKLEKLREDYKEVSQQPFIHFFCPILFKDEDVPLCQAHIINHAFPDSSRRWTIQRKDVDNFYGTNFESDFVSIQYNESGSPGAVLVDKTLSNRFSPRILADNKPVEYFVSQKGNIPKHFIPLKFENDGKTILLGIKMSPKDFFAAAGKKWEIEISKDVRIPALVALIKAAHLTLFELIGYHYALSASGHFVGGDILGKFYVQNIDRPKSEIIENAHPFFREFTHMVRPVQSNSFNLRGTIADRTMLICKEQIGLYWAWIVFIRTSQSLHAVMIPILGQADTVEKFLNFLKSSDEVIEASFCRFEKNRWEISNGSFKLHWPKTGILYP